MYTLAQDGDQSERMYGHYLAAHFAAYEMLWGEFIIPLTNRPANIGFRKGLDPLLARMAETHYSIFRHLVSAHQLLDLAKSPPMDAETLYDAVFCFLGAATEMAEDFLVVWARLQAPESLAGFAPREPDSTAGELREYLRSQEYQSDRQVFLQGGRPVNFPLHSEEEIILECLGEAGDDASRPWSVFRSVRNRVRHYRNTVAHHPLVGKWVTKEGELLYPREPYLAALDSWQKVRANRNRRLYDDPARIAHGFLTETEQALNNLWLALLPLLRSVARDSRYTKLIPHYGQTPVPVGRSVAWTGYQTSEIFSGDGAISASEDIAESPSAGSAAWPVSGDD
jgi:hypothetical protein